MAVYRSTFARHVTPCLVADGLRVGACMIAHDPTKAQNSAENHGRYSSSVWRLFYHSRPLKGCSVRRWRSTPSRQRTLTSILSGCERGM
jgi:hypothetical protein